MNKKLTIFFTFGCLLFSTTTAFGQVTIGTNSAPTTGALLQLKDGGTYSNGETANKGLCLPRVELTSTNNLFPMFEANGADYKQGATTYTKTTEDAAHIGLVVYNTNKCAAGGQGIHIWDGTQWELLGEITSPDVHYYTDPRDGEVYPYRSFGTTAGDWMLENLRYNPITDEDVAGGFDKTTFTQKATSSYTDKYFYYPINLTYTVPSSGGAPANWDTYKKNGILYNWAAATNNENPSTDNQGQGQTTVGPTTPIQGICPPTWHLPSDTELNELEAAIQNSSSAYSTTSTATPWNTSWNTQLEFRGDIQGEAMKSICPPVDSSTATGGTSFPTIQGGFNVLLVGLAGLGAAANYGVYTCIWSSSSDNSGSAFSRDIRNGNSTVYRAGNHRDYLYSVRCKKD